MVAVMEMYYVPTTGSCIPSRVDSNFTAASYSGISVTVGELTKEDLRHPNEKLADLRLGKEKWGRR